MQLKSEITDTDNPEFKSPLEAQRSRLVELREASGGAFEANEKADGRRYAEPQLM